MKYNSEILKIIEAGMEGNKIKLKAYANLLISKCCDDEKFQNSIISILTGEYKKKDIFKF